MSCLFNVFIVLVFFSAENLWLLLGLIDFFFFFLTMNYNKEAIKNQITHVESEFLLSHVQIRCSHLYSYQLPKLVEQLFDDLQFHVFKIKLNSTKTSLCVPEVLQRFMSQQ